MDKTAFTGYRQNLKIVKNVTDTPAIHTKAAHFFREILKGIEFENGTLNGTI